MLYWSWIQNYGFRSGKYGVICTVGTVPTVEQWRIANVIYHLNVWVIVGFKGNGFHEHTHTPCS